jgi:ferrous iron transport protein A
MLFLNELKKGQKAIIRTFRNERLSNKLIEMGCLPGEEVMLSRTAPLGCPFAISVAGYELSLRKEEAATVVVELVSR